MGSAQRRRGLADDGEPPDHNRNQLALIEREKSTPDLALQPGLTSSSRRPGPSKTAEVRQSTGRRKNKSRGRKVRKEKKEGKPSRAELKSVNQLLKKCEQTLAALFAAFFGGAAAGKGPELELLKRLGEERLTQLTDKWEVDVDGCALKNEQNKFVWKGMEVHRPQRGQAVRPQRAAEKPDELACHRDRCAAPSVRKKARSKNLFQSTAGNKTAEQARSGGLQRAKGMKRSGENRQGQVQP